MSDVIKGVFTRKAPDDLAEKLRAIADAVDAGEVVDFVAAYVSTAESMYRFVPAAPAHDCVVLSSLLHDSSIRSMRT
jgi:hypothetical protein